MKLESESIYSHVSLATKPDLKIFSYDDNCLETPWKGKNDIMGGDKQKVVSDGDIKKFDTTSDSLDKIEEVKSLPVAQDFLSVENPITGSKETGDSFSPDGITLSEKENEFYSDKSVTELELPEFAVCFNGDGDFHAVKDICVDDGLPSLSKTLFEEGDICCSRAFNSLHSDLDVNNDLTKETGENVGAIVSGTNPFLECDRNIDIASMYCVKTSNGNGKDYTNEIVNLGSATSPYSVTNPFVECDSRTEVTEKFGSKTFSEDEDKSFGEDVDHETPRLNVTNPFLDCHSEPDVAKLSGSTSVAKLSGSTSPIGYYEEDLDQILDVDSDEETTSEILASMKKLGIINSAESFSGDKNEDQEQTDQDVNKEEHSCDSMIPSAEELDKCNEAKVPFNSQVESLGISYEIDSSSPETSRDEDREYTDRQRSVETLSMPIIDEETEETPTAARLSFSSQYGCGETSFSAVGPLSEHISYSGQIPYSGSISYRSDSSTTSTRSFAFPVLNTEWNSSPVRMAKADKKQFQKHRGWRTFLICCGY